MTQPISGVVFLNHILAQRWGRKTGGARKALIRRGASRVEGQCSGEIGQLHGRRKPSVTTFLLFHSSAFAARLSTPPGHPWHGLVISRCTDGYCVYKCVYFCVDWGSCLSRSELFWQVQLPRTYLQLLLRFWERSLNQSVGMRRVKAHALIYTHSLTVLEYK